MFPTTTFNTWNGVSFVFACAQAVSSWLIFAMLSLRVNASNCATLTRICVRSGSLRKFPERHLYLILPFVHRGVLLYELLHAIGADAKDRVGAEADEKLVVGEHGVIAGEVLGVAEGRH